MQSSGFMVLEEAKSYGRTARILKLTPQNNIARLAGACTVSMTVYSTFKEAKEAADAIFVENRANGRGADFSTYDGTPDERAKALMREACELNRSHYERELATINGMTKED